MGTERRHCCSKYWLLPVEITWIGVFSAEIRPLEGLEVRPLRRTVSSTSRNFTLSKYIIPGLRKLIKMGLKSGYFRNPISGCPARFRANRIAKMCQPLAKPYLVLEPPSERVFGKSMLFKWLVYMGTERGHCCSEYGLLPVEITWIGLSRPRYALWKVWKFDLFGAPFLQPVVTLLSPHKFFWASVNICKWARSRDISETPYMASLYDFAQIE
jgi:hypothetical protein